MKRNIFLLFFLIFFAMWSLYSRPVDTTVARRVALTFYKARIPDRASFGSARLAYVQEAALSTTRGPQVVFYVFNIGNGYVVVSGDDRMKPVLGYSTEGNFNAEEVPATMQSFLDSYITELGVLESFGLDADPRIASRWSALLSGQTAPATRNTAVVLPLLSTVWDQNAPYNELCPVAQGGPGGHAYAGCVATAMGQIMRYWRHPEHGTGSHTYVNTDTNITCFDTLSANFAAATYDYSLMPASITTSSPDSQRLAVATLLLHCGISVNMGYNYTGSGAYSANVPNAMFTYFGYPLSLRIKRDEFPGNWEMLIKQELDSLRPVQYSGQGSGGHAFVCDGYDDQDFFHFNWGWSGSHNGYYQLSSLLPGTHDFNTSQSAIVGLYVNKPMMQSSTHRLSFLTESGEVSGTKSMRVRVVNHNQPVGVQVSGNFLISADSLQFDTVAILPSCGGTVYVRYLSGAPSTVEHETLVITAGTLSDTLEMVGMTCDHLCLPPRNLTLTRRDRNIDLQWEAPDVDSTGLTLTWDTLYTTSYKYPSNYTVSMFHRYCDTDLVRLHGHQLTEVSFYAKAGIYDCNIVIYKGGTYENGIFQPGEMLRFQPVSVSSLTMGQWNTVVLDTAVTIDAAQELWVGFNISVNGGSYAIPVGLVANYVPEKGDVYAYHNASGSVTWKLFGNKRNFMIKAGVGATEPHVGYRVEEGAHPVALLSETATQYSDTLWIPGLHHYTVAALYGSGCEASIQDTIMVVEATQYVYDSLEVDVCANQMPYSWRGHTLYAAGTYIDTVIQPSWDTVFFYCLHLSLLPVSEYDTVVFTHAPEYDWNGTLLTENGEYTQTFTAANGCDSVVTLYLTVSVGVNQASEALVCRVYPNPTDGVCRVRGEALAGAVVRVYDVLGRMRHQQILQGDVDMIDLSSQASGVYLLCIEDRDGRRAILRLLKR